MAKIAYSDDAYLKAIEDYMTAHAHATGMVSEQVRRDGNRFFIGNDGTGLTMSEMRELIAKLRKL